MEKPIELPTEIFIIAHNRFNMSIKCRNPFTDLAFLEIKNTSGGIIYQMYLQDQLITIPEIVEPYLTEPYIVEVTNLKTLEKKSYSVDYK